MLLNSTIQVQYEMQIFCKAIKIVDLLIKLYLVVLLLVLLRYIVYILYILEATLEMQL